MKKMPCFLLLIAVFLCGCVRDAEPLRSEIYVMNTFLIQTVYGSEDVIQENERTVRDLEKKFSRTLPDSEIAELTADGTYTLTEDTQTVLAAALSAMEATDGAYDPRLGALRDLWGFGGETPAVPSPAVLAEALEKAQNAQVVLDGTAAVSGGADLDLGGAAKGYTLDKIRGNLDAAQVESALIDFGGALLVYGTKPDGELWRIGVRDPLGTQGVSIAEFSCSDICMETSGISQQSFEENGLLYHHLLDPATGYPADNPLASVTVLSASGLEADIYATALFIMGPDDGLAFAEANGMAVLFITQDKKLITSSAFPYEITITDDSFERA